MTELRPIHHSVLNSTRRKPRNMERTYLPNEARELIEREALSIFTDMTNAGCSLQATLTAVFLSGMNAATEAQR